MIAQDVRFIMLTAAVVLVALPFICFGILSIRALLGELLEELRNGSGGKGGAV